VGRERRPLGERIVSTGLRVGDELGPSEWLEVRQERIDSFAACTYDQGCAHVDPGRAGVGPFGTTPANGFLALSLCVPLLYEVSPIGPDSTFLNYGVDRVRFPSPVPAGSRIRARFTVSGVEEQENGERIVLGATVERKGQAKPVCVADLILLVQSSNRAAA
jgi:acyl dehydratase